MRDNKCDSVYRPSHELHGVLSSSTRICFSAKLVEVFGVPNRSQIYGFKPFCAIHPRQATAGAISTVAVRPNASLRDREGPDDRRSSSQSTFPLRVSPSPTSAPRVE